MLKQRILTAIFLIPITLLILFYCPPWLFCCLMGVITLAGAWEWSNLMTLKKASWRWLYLLFMMLILFNALFISVSFILIAAFIWWLFATLLIVVYPKGGERWGKGFFWRGLMGVFVLVPSWASIVYIRSQDEGVYALLFLFILIWGADSAAYFVGKKWGKTKLAPHVSPGKSLQGVMGALVFSILIAVATLWVFRVPTQQWLWAVSLSVITVIFSVIGDLFESMLKRQVGLKDSGQLLPGHGGLLDRIDSLTAAAPLFAFGAWLLGMYL